MVHIFKASRQMSSITEDCACSNGSEEHEAVPWQIWVLLRGPLLREPLLSIEEPLFSQFAAQGVQLLFQFLHSELQECDLALQVRNDGISPVAKPRPGCRCGCHDDGQHGQKLIHAGGLRMLVESPLMPHDTESVEGCQPGSRRRLRGWYGRACRAELIRDFAGCWGDAKERAQAACEIVGQAAGAHLEEKIALNKIESVRIIYLPGDHENTAHQAWPDVMDPGNHFVRWQRGTSQVEQHGVKVISADHRERLHSVGCYFTLASQPFQKDAERLAGFGIALDQEYFAILSWQ